MSEKWSTSTGSARLVTNLTPELVPHYAVIEVEGLDIGPLRRTFGDVPTGGVLAYLRLRRSRWRSRCGTAPPRGGWGWEWAEGSGRGWAEASPCRVSSSLPRAPQEARTAARSRRHGDDHQHHDQARP